LGAGPRKALLDALGGWLATRLAPLEPLRKLASASTAEAGGPELRALVIRLVEAGGMLDRASSGLDQFTPEQRDALRRLKVKVGALDLFVPEMLRPRPLALWRELVALSGKAPPEALPEMPPVVPGRSAPLGYRRLGQQNLRIDMAEKLLREAHGHRAAKPRRSFALDPALARSMGLTTESYTNLLRQAGFQPIIPRPQTEGAFGPPTPLTWRWRPPRRPARPQPPRRPPGSGAFAALAELVG